jgi:hypothetical protein
LGASVEACKIVIHNRWCFDASDSQRQCLCRLSQANLVLYDSSNNVVKTINVGDTCGKATLEYDLCPKLTNQVKLQQTTGEYLNIFELEIFNPTGTNVARGKSATSSSELSSQEDPQRAVDGNLSTMFHSGGETGSWLNIDLGSSFEARRIVIHNRWCEDVNDSQYLCLCRLSQANLVLYDSSNNVVKTINVGEDRSFHGQSRSK